MFKLSLKAGVSCCWWKIQHPKITFSEYTNNTGNVMSATRVIACLCFPVSIWLTFFPPDQCSQKWIRQACMLSSILTNDFNEDSATGIRRIQSNCVQTFDTTNSIMNNLAFQWLCLTIFLLVFLCGCLCAVNCVFCVNVCARLCEGRVCSVWDVIQTALCECCKAEISVKIWFHFSACLLLLLIFIIN